jgi:autotransporter-associated beta strand protein
VDLKSISTQSLMKPKYFLSRSRALVAASTIIFTHSASAQWIGGSSSNISDTTNWTGGVINGDFSSITSMTTLTLGGNLTLPSGSSVATTMAPVDASTTVFTVANPAGIAIGMKVSGTNAALGTYVKELSGSQVTLSLALSGAASGNYTFLRAPFDFNFGSTELSGTTTAADVSLVIDSDVPGTQRTVSIAGNLLSSQRNIPANAVTFGPDIAFQLTGQLVFARMTGDVGPASPVPIPPTVTINGPVNLGSFSTSNSRLVLEGGNAIINGIVSGNGAGTGAAINVGSIGNATTLTLTNPGNTFGGGISNSGNGLLVADSIKPVGNVGEASSLGTGSLVSRINATNRTITLRGFTTPQSTNREISLGNGRLNNDGAAPLSITGPVINNAGTGNTTFGGAYLNHEVPNVISGLITDAASRPTGVLIGGGVWRLTNEGNTFTRAVGVSGGPGILRFDSLQNIGEPSSMGLSETLTIGAATTSNVSYLEYTGRGPASTNRAVSITGGISGGGGNGLLANGTGPVEYGGGFSSQTLTPNTTSGTLATRIFYLDGSGDGVVSGVGALADVPGTVVSRLALTKRGTGRWTFSGSGLHYGGATIINAGTMVYDYAVNPQLQTPALGTITVDGGAMVIKGSTTGAVTQVLPTVNLGTNTSYYTAEKIVLDASNGHEIDLTVGSLQGNTNAVRATLFDVSGDPDNVFRVTALGSNLKVNNGVLTNNGATLSNGRATLILKKDIATTAGENNTPTTAAYHFPTVGTDGLTGILAPAALIPLPASGAVNTQNYILRDNITLTGALSVSTLTIDSDLAPVTLNMGTNTITGSSGRSMLLRGDNDIAINSTGNFSPVSYFVFNYLTGNAKATLGSNIATGQPVIFAGTGFTEYTGVGFGNPTGAGSATSGITVIEGTLRVSTAQDLTSVTDNSKLRLRVSGAVLEVGADLNGGTAGDVSNGIGADPADASSTTNLDRRIVLLYNAGFSASGGRRVLDFQSGGAQQALVWGKDGFLTQWDTTTDGGFALRLSSPRADATVEIRNPIDLNVQSNYGRRRTVDVADGSAAVDAELSGVLSGGAGLLKTGAGTLLLSGANTHRGDTIVKAGKLVLGNASSAGTGRIFIEGGGTIGGTGASGSATVNGAFAVELNGATSSKLSVNGDLDISGAALTVAVLSPATQPSYVIAEYSGALTGTFASVPAGYTVRYNVGANSKQIILDLGAAPTNAFTSYMSAAFPGVTDPAIIGADQDPDKDGLKNSVEFVLNSDPDNGTQENLPMVAKTGDSMVFHFTRRKDAASAGYPSVAQISGSLLNGSWTDVTAGVVVTDNAGNPTLLEDVAVTIPVTGTDTKLFVRMKVSAP